MVKKGIIVCLLLSIIASSTFARIVKTGTLSQNYTLTDLKGKTYDMYSVLEEDKYILVFFTFLT